MEEKIVEQKSNAPITKDALIKENEALKEKLREVYAEASKRINELNYTNAFARLNILFEVLKNEHLYPNNFIEAVVKEIIDTVNIKEEEAEEQ